jgi:Electron transfer DM13
MKFSIILVLLGAIWLSSCTKNNGTSTETLKETIDTASAKLIKTGVFTSSSGYTVSGKSSILLKDSIYSLSLENFSSSNGPDLYVYISKQITPNAIVDLGRLKSTNGNQVYTLTTQFNVAEYKYVIIYCKQFSRTFGTAELK